MLLILKEILPYLLYLFKFFECPGGLKSVGPTQSELTQTRREDLKMINF